ncbi:hypothetical protein TraAM80_09672 [Trypanosoma rangeli]|uniref:Uncharacterized protein n=1 Tax=Trypanosoma rangeli TaxID=5698 RepID=A0A3R7JTR4_TRYRA|nr:uncharacterized protein TraAM80_09672 [Trypanosoma rangeli]RNE96703.1 hypothetical protein TraAM80_09672 [Trypanosoma rangeli]|eukprot:RNE96703.1 hypothetical protein TraAM80_09672 [Trypanosoma rangeli]
MNIRAVAMFGNASMVLLLEQHPMIYGKALVRLKRNIGRINMAGDIIGNPGEEGELGFGVPPERTSLALTCVVLLLPPYRVACHHWCGGLLPHLLFASSHLKLAVSYAREDGGSR